MEGVDGVVLGKRLLDCAESLCSSGEGIDCSDPRALPVLRCMKTVRVQTEEEHELLAKRRRTAGWNSSLFAEGNNEAPGAAAAAAAVDQTAGEDMKDEEENKDPKDLFPKISIVCLEEVDLKEPVGSGTYATVYRGIYHKQQVAVKMFNDKATMESLSRELAISCTLSHPNIVKCVGVGWKFDDASGVVEAIKRGDYSRTDGSMEALLSSLRKPVLLMEFCSMGSLFQALYPINVESKTRRGSVSSLPLVDPHSRKIARGVASALQHLHAHGFAHFDLCSSNVLVCSSFITSSVFVLCASRPSCLSVCSNSLHLILNRSSLILDRQDVALALDSALLDMKYIELLNCVLLLHATMARMLIGRRKQTCTVLAF